MLQADRQHEDPKPNRNRNPKANRNPNLYSYFICSHFITTYLCRCSNLQCHCETLPEVFSLGMLNDYRIFDYRIKCSFSFSFVSYSILEILFMQNYFSRVSCLAEIFQCKQKTRKYGQHYIPKVTDDK